jgi:hypothetical protein
MTPVLAVTIAWAMLAVLVTVLVWLVARHNR